MCSYEWLVDKILALHVKVYMIVLAVTHVCVEVVYTFICNAEILSTKHS
jgi:hypothetical protein